MTQTHKKGKEIFSKLIQLFSITNKWKFGFLPCTHTISSFIHTWHTHSIHYNTLSKAHIYIERLSWLHFVPTYALIIAY